MDAPQTPPSSNRTGVIGLVLSATGVCLCGFWLLSIPGLIVSLVGLRHTPKTTAIIGTVLGAIGILEFLLIAPLLVTLVLPRIAASVRTSDRRVAQIEVNSLHRQVELYMIEHDGQLPNDFDLSELTRGDDPYLTHKDDLIDPWGNPYDCEVENPIYNIDFDIISWGADGHPGGTGNDSDIISEAY